MKLPGRNCATRYWDAVGGIRVADSGKGTGMIWKIILRHSLKTRITLATLTIFVVCIWMLTAYTSQSLRQDIERALGDQQFSTVSILADHIDRDLDERLRSLEIAARDITPAILGNAANLQTLLENRPILLQLFNAGVFATRLEGVAIADAPISLGRIGVDYMNDANSDFMVKVLNGNLTVSRPIEGKMLRVPVIPMGAPIRDPQRKVIGALIGVVNLSLPNFLNRIADNHYGKTGDYLVVAPQGRLVSHSRFSIEVVIKQEVS
jgi:hypothetical protein